ncbi:MAG TPA: hypothetical protein VL990_15260 [Acidobacteriaceae bacterium]|nr:hypothetical protein [Acidobacteriaceae bacterium]
MGLDAATHEIFLPTAEMEASTGRRPQPKPGTFRIVVAAQE